MHAHETSAPSCASIDESTDPCELKRIGEAAVAAGEALEGATTAEGFLAYTDAFAAANVALGWLALATGGELAIGSRVEHMGTGQRGLVWGFRAPDVEVYFADIDTSDWVAAGALRVVDAPVSP